MYIGISKCLWKFHVSIDKSYSTQNTVDWEVTKGCSCKSLWHFNYVQSCLSKYEGVVWWLKRRIQERYNPKHMFRKWRNAVSSDSYKLHFLLLPKNFLPSMCGSYLRSKYTCGTRVVLLVLIRSIHMPGVYIHLYALSRSYLRYSYPWRFLSRTHAVAMLRIIVLISLASCTQKIWFSKNYRRIWKWGYAKIR